MVNHPSIDKKKIKRIFNFKFDFEEMKMIHKMSKKLNLNKFFTKMMSINKMQEEIDIDKDHFNYISDYLLDFIEQNCKHLSSINESKFTFKIK